MPLYRRKIPQLIEYTLDEPNAWRSENSKWTESYRLKPLGLLSPPQIEELK